MAPFNEVMKSYLVVSVVDSNLGLLFIFIIIGPDEVTICGGGGRNVVTGRGQKRGKNIPEVVDDVRGNNSSE